MIKTIFLTILILLLTPTLSFAQTPTSSKIPTSEELEKINDRVDELKNKVASRVAELNLVEKRGFIGTVTDISDTQIVVSDLNNKTRIIQVDELTKFSSNSEDDFGLSDIKEGSKLGALGLYNKDSKKLLARFINEINIPIFIQGVITDKDEKEFTVTVVTQDKKEYLIDIENITKTYQLSEDELDTSGFSKFKQLQSVFIIGFPDVDEKNRISATKAVIVPDLPKNPKIEVNIPESTDSSPTPTASEDEEE